MYGREPGEFKVDSQETPATLKRRFRTRSYATAFVLCVIALGLGFFRLKPATPVVNREGLRVESVRRGDMIRTVSGSGTLVPKAIRVIPAFTGGQIEQRLAQPGSNVRANEVILVLSNPALEESEADAEWQLKEAEAEYKSLQTQLNDQLLDQKSQAATIRSEYQQAKLQADTNLQLNKFGLTSSLVYKLSQVRADELAHQSEMADRKAQAFAESIQAQLAGEEAKVGRLQAQVESKKALVAQLQVRPGLDGVLQALPVEVGQQVTAGTVIARVVQPKNLEAELKIAETQAKYIQLGQTASIDTHDGVVPGRVLRIAPVVQDGTVTVDVDVTGRLPQGARPDLGVDGTIEVEKLRNVLFIDRPSQVDVNGRIRLFKLASGGNEAMRVEVQLGFVSGDKAQILRGLQDGDQVILSDMSAFRDHNLVELK